MIKRRDTSPTSVLIVDPDPISAMHTARLVSEIGFHSAWRTATIAGALRVCATTPFDVAIVELDLGDRDGADLIVALRAWPGAVDYVLAVTLERSRLQQAMKFKVPADAFLQKPLSRHVLETRIALRLRRSRVVAFDPACEEMLID